MKIHNATELLRELKTRMGDQPIRSVACARYTFGDKVDEADTILQFELGDGSFVLLDSESSGDAVRVRFERWEDHFADPLSDENKEYVRTHGRWRCFDQSGTPPFSGLIGARLSAMEAMLDPDQEIIGLRLCFGAARVCYIVFGDAGFVLWTLDSPLLSTVSWSIATV